MRNRARSRHVPPAPESAGADPIARRSGVKNLVILHLESISRERLTIFESAFPNLRALMRKSVAFDNYFSSATSTRMAVTYLWHGNDFELDASPAFHGMRQANVTRNIFSVLHDRGYKTGVVALNAFHEQMPTELGTWPGNLPPVYPERVLLLYQRAFPYRHNER